MTQESWIDGTINRRARGKGQWEDRHYAEDYDRFDPEQYIKDCEELGQPLVITWFPNTVRLHCREYYDIHGIPDILGIEEVPTLFTGHKGMERYRIFLIPYLITGYSIPHELEQDPEPLVSFTTRTIETIMEAEHTNE